MSLTLGQLIIEKSSGDLGTIVEFDNQGRTHRIRYRTGRDTWHYPHELHAV